MTPEREQRQNNRRTAWVLGAIAFAFFVGFMLKHVMLK